MRLLRLLKVARGLRALRSVSMLDSLQVIIKSISASMSTLFWSLIVLSIIQCISGMIISQLLQNYFDDWEEHPQKDVHIVFAYYGTFTRSMLTMFEVTMANWATPLRVLTDFVGEEYGFVILFYRCVCGFAVLNVIGAVFIQQTMKVMSQDTDIMLMEKQRTEAGFEKKMHQLFNILDVSRDCRISWEELEQKIDDPHVKTQAYFLGIDMDDIEDLYSLLENPEEMTIHEFVAAAGRLKKQAKTIDVAHLLAHVKLIEKSLDTLQVSQDSINSKFSADMVRLLKVSTERMNYFPCEDQRIKGNGPSPDKRVVDIDNRVPVSPMSQSM
jgi:hypothetical protein